MRLNRYLASAGLGSRRACETLITEGLVRINGKTITDLATQVLPGDSVVARGKKIESQNLIYLVLHKPRGILTTCADPQGRATVIEMLPPHYGRLFHVGRLDKDSEGLLILTNDGALAQKLTHPAHLVDKEYEVVIDKPFDLTHRPKLITGIFIEGGKAKMESVYSIVPTKLRIVLRQGIKRQIRLMLYKMGYEVLKLKRTRIGHLKLDDMKPGEYRQLRGEEVRMLEEESAPPRRSSTRPPARTKRDSQDFQD